MENHNMYGKTGNTHDKLPFSIAILNYQRVLEDDVQNAPPLESSSKVEISPTKKPRLLVGRLNLRLDVTVWMPFFEHGEIQLGVESGFKVEMEHQNW